jgi:integrase
MASLLHGAGLRWLDSARLRVNDVDLERRELSVREGKGAKDRTTVLPTRLVEPLRARRVGVRRRDEEDLRDGAGWVELPDALVRKYPNAGRE